MPLQPSQVLNQRYRIIHPLGEGGFGAVYLAWDLNLNAQVAIKESLEISPAAEKQFRREANLLFRLRHPNLPRVFDCFSLPGQGLYLAMDYIEGENLEHRLYRQGGALPPDQVLDWIVQICDALDYLHHQSPPVIHRDIKPANIILAGDGRPYLVDFGISKELDPNRQTTLGARALTPGYAPPEQYGQGSTDARSDIYALGATLYRLLSGVVPPASMDITAGVASPPVSLHAINPSVPLPLGAAVMQAMQLNRTQRWSSAGEFKQALAGSGAVVQTNHPLTQLAATQVVSGRAESSNPSTLQPGSLGKAPARSGLWLALAGLAVLALLAGGFWIGQKARSTPPPVAAVIAPATLKPLDTAVAVVSAPATAAPPAASPTETAPPAPTQAAAPPPATPRPAASATADPSLPPAGAQSGATWTRPADGMQMVFVPAGEFLMGSADSDPRANSDEKPQHAVKLDAYWIDQTEVTYAMFRHFVTAAGYNWSGAYSGQDNQPVVNVNWEDASSYCAWAGGSLPSAAQWEKAARSTDGRLFPWGNNFDSARLNYCDKNCPYDWGQKTANDGWARAAPVGSFPAGASPFGVLDMAGNVWEWTRDWYATYDNLAPASNPSGRASNPSGPATGKDREIRGGAWDSVLKLIRTANRGANDPAYGYDYLGFRCAR